MDEYNKGDIFLDYVNNEYLIIIGHIRYTDVYRCLVLTGVSSMFGDHGHKYIGERVVNIADLNNEDLMYQVGGIY